MNIFEKIASWFKTKVEPEVSPKRLIDELREIKATYAARKAAEEAQKELAAIQKEKADRKIGRDSANNMFEQYRERILKKAIIDFEFNEFEIPISTWVSEKSLDVRSGTFAEHLIQMFENHGLQAKVVWTELPPGDGSYYQIPSTLYDANLVVTW